jgi:hypothetical protein
MHAAPAARKPSLFEKTWPSDRSPHEAKRNAGAHGRGGESIKKARTSFLKKRSKKLLDVCLPDRVVYSFVRRLHHTVTLMRSFCLAFGLILSMSTGTASAAAPAWAGYAGNAQHTAQAPARARPLLHVHWTAALDKAPQANGATSLAHYASPMFTAGGTLLLAVKEAPVNGWHVHAREFGFGILWRMTTDYILPPHDWAPAFPMAITPQNTVYAAAAGGTVMRRESADAADGRRTRMAFYDIAEFWANTAAMTQSVMIDTPITADAAGNVYFGFVVTGTNPAGLSSGIARISASGQGSWISAARAAADATMTQVAMGCAPALSPDGTTVYIAVSNGAAGALVGLDAATLAPKYKAALLDPSSGAGAWITDNAAASPTIGPDGDIFYGVLENPYPAHNDRGWLLHFDATLQHAKTPGSFGWDETASVVPASAIPSYHGTSPYLLMTKDNNYRGIGTGDGRNRIAILDPAGASPDPVLPAVMVMRTVESVLDPTAVPGSAGATYAWCVNSAVVDTGSGTVFASSEDGALYRWDLASNALTQSVQLTQPGPQAYAPSVVGPDGLIFAIANGTLYAAGR